MRLEQLHYLQALSRYKSMNAASQILYVSPQAISLAMKQLENELGITILERSPQGVTLTKAGTLVLNKSQIIIDALEDLTTEINLLKEPSVSLKLKGKLTIVVNPFFYTLENMSESILHFRKNHPAVTVAIVETEPSEIIHNLSQPLTDQNNVHIGVVNKIFHPDPFPSTMTFYPLYEFGFYAYVPKSHPLAKYTQISISTLLKYPLAVYQSSSSTTNPSQLYLEQYGKPNIVLTSDKLSFLNDAIAKKFAIGFISGATKPHLEKNYPDIFTWIKIKNVPKSAVGLLLPNQLLDHPIIKSYLPYFLKT